MLQDICGNLVWALDPTEVFRDAGMEPDPWQEEFLRSEDRRIILNCSRQSGKSTTTAAKTIGHACTRPGAGVVLLSPSQRQSAILS